MLLIQCHHSTPRVPCAWITVPNWSQLASQAQPSQTLLHLLWRLQLLITPVPLPLSSLPQSPVLSSLQHPRPLCAIFAPSCALPLADRWLRMEVPVICLLSLHLCPPTGVKIPVHLSSTHIYLWARDAKGNKAQSVLREQVTNSGNQSPRRDGPSAVKKIHVEHCLTAHTQLSWSGWHFLAPYDTSIC